MQIGHARTHGPIADGQPIRDLLDGQLTLGQLGLIVGIGVLIDTLLVRVVIVPAVFGLLGDRIWWPGRIPGGSRAPGAAPSDGRAAGGGESEHVEHSEAALT